MAFLKDLLASIVAIVRLITELVSAIKKAKNEGWIADLETVSAAIKEAKTDEERKALAKRLADLVRRS